MDANLLFFYSGIEKRAARVVYHKFGINYKELNMLTGIAAFMMIKGKKVISRDNFIDWIGVNYRLEKRCWGYIWGLVNKGALHRLSYRRPDGNCLAISPFGLVILEAFDQAINEYEAKHTILSKYKSVVIDPNNLPEGYVIRQQGRQS